MFCVSLLLSVTDIKTKEIVLTLDLGKPSRHGMVVVVFKLHKGTARAQVVVHFQPFEKAAWAALG